MDGWIKTQESYIEPRNLSQAKHQAIGTLRCTQGDAIGVPG
jgi:hypothetical protein